MYKIIDEKLGLASCSISDLTMKQVHHFLSQWEEGASIGTLTLFYDEGRNMIVLNQDNERFEFILEMAQKYMAASKERRKEILREASEGIRETMWILHMNAKYIEAKTEIRRTMKNHIQGNHRDVLEEIVAQKSKSAPYIAFRYGVMCGKRAERARRKAGAAE